MPLASSIDSAFSPMGARPERTAAACSCATAESFPSRNDSISGTMQPASTITSRDAVSDAASSERSAYSCASTRPSLSPSLSRLTKGAKLSLGPDFFAFEVVECLSSAAMFVRASDARLRTATLSEPSSLTSSCVASARDLSESSAMSARACAAMPIDFSEPHSSWRTSSGTAPAFAMADRFSGTLARLRSSWATCSAAPELPRFSIPTASLAVAIWFVTFCTHRAMSAPAACSHESTEPPSKSDTSSGMPPPMVEWPFAMVIRFSAVSARACKAPAAVS